MVEEGTRRQCKVNERTKLGKKGEMIGKQFVEMR